MMKPLRIEDILKSDIWDVDFEPHIKVNSDKCKNCISKQCVNLCPAGCFSFLDNRIVYSYEGCLECGACRVLCEEEAVEWNYPKSGRGIHYRFG